MCTCRDKYIEKHIKLGEKKKGGESFLLFSSQFTKKKKMFIQEIIL